jgi:serine kinase of HPr protein (carbohydrate metabolism regulator)
MTLDSAPASPRALIHATAVAVLDAAAPFGGALEGAVLLLGDSGSGKSDVALRLIAMGGKLVSDDQTVLFMQGRRLYADAPLSLSGRIEIRGVGIIEIDRAPAAPVVLAVRLETDAAVARLPEPAFYALPAGLQADVKVPILTFVAHESSTPAKIAAAAAALVRGTFVAGGLQRAGFPFL